jgi:hypothetical protein
VLDRIGCELLNDQQRILLSPLIEPVFAKESRKQRRIRASEEEVAWKMAVDAAPCVLGDSPQEGAAV